MEVCIVSIREQGFVIGVRAGVLLQFLVVLLHLSCIVFVRFSVFICDSVKAVDAVIAGDLAFAIAVSEAFSDYCSNVMNAVGTR